MAQLTSGELKIVIKFTLVATAAVLFLAGQSLAATSNVPYHIQPKILAGGKDSAHLMLDYSPSFGGIIASKNVAAVNSPATGVFCVVPIVPLNAGSLPIVSVEWGASSGNSLMAFLVNSVFDCPAGQIDVRTYDFNAGVPPVSSVLVAFTVFVD